jgi:gamma-glutamyltranspeptidase/glutathione hydrolase
MLSQFASSKRLFMKGDRAPRPGEIFVQSSLAETLEAIAENGRDAFYEGHVAKAIADFCQNEGGLLSEEDLASHKPEAREPVRTDYKGYTVCEQPLNSQGYMLLQILNMIEGLDMRDSLQDNPSMAIHALIEATKVAIEDRNHYAGDPGVVNVPLARLLSKEYAGERRNDIKATARVSSAGGKLDGDTTSFVVADRLGNVVSFIQSVFIPFGSGVVAGDTGVLLNNRMTGFSLDEGHPNSLKPGKRTMHTLNTYIVLKNGHPIIAGGTPGADLQVQTNAQILLNILELGKNVQDAIDAPRWSYSAGEGVSLESRFPQSIADELREMGHKTSLVEPWSGRFGRAQVLVRDPDSGTYAGGSDSRGEGCALGI